MEKHDQAKIPSFFHTIPSEADQYDGIARLLLHFQWKWVGIIAPDNEEGEGFIQALPAVLSKKGICTAFTEKIKNIVLETNIEDLSLHYERLSFFLNTTQTKVFVTYFNTRSMASILYLFLMAKSKKLSISKVWIMTAHWDFQSETFQLDSKRETFHGVLSFAIHSPKVLGFQLFLHLLRIYFTRPDGRSMLSWKSVFICLAQYLSAGQENRGFCSGKKNPKNLPGPLSEMEMPGHSYSIYIAVYAIAHALHAMHSAGQRWRAMMERDRKPFLQPWEVCS